MISWIGISALGGTNAMAPAAAVIATGLVIGRAWRLALWWCLLFSLGMVLVLASKVAFVGWCIGIPALDFTGFSGHAARATAVAPVLAYVVLQKQSANARWWGIAAGLVFGVIIGVSRLALHVHSVSEAVSGCVLGAAISLGFIWVAGVSQKFVFHRPLVALCLIILLLVPYTEPAPTQRWIEEFSKYLSGRNLTCSPSSWTLSAS